MFLEILPDNRLGGYFPGSISRASWRARPAHSVLFSSAPIFAAKCRFLAIGTPLLLNILALFQPVVQVRPLAPAPISIP